MAYTKQVKAAAILNNTFSGSFLYGDGVSLCSTAHPTVGGFTNANRPAADVDLNETISKTPTSTWRPGLTSVVCWRPNRANW